MIQKECLIQKKKQNKKQKVCDKIFPYILRKVIYNRNQPKKKGK